MKKFLPKVFLSLGVMVMAGTGFAASASAQTATNTASAPRAAVETSCEYPANSGLQTNNTTVGTSPGATTGTCWTTNTVPDPTPVAAAPVPTTTPTTTSPTTVGTASSPAVQTAAPAPIISTTASTALAFTGADVWQTVLVGTILIGGGLFFVGLARRRRTSRSS
jgi:hypothetical protein